MIDAARVLSRYVDAIIARVFLHSDVAGLAAAVRGAVDPQVTVPASVTAKITPGNLPDSSGDVLQPLGFYGLGQVVQRMNLKRLQRELIVRGHEYDFRQRRC